MTKLTVAIEIEDVNDRYQCADAIRRLFEMICEHHSREEFDDILVKHVMARMTEDEWEAMMKFDEACRRNPEDERRLVL